MFDREIEANALEAYHNDPLTDSDDDEELQCAAGTITNEGGEIEL